MSEYGNILDGYNRIKVCRELGINDYPVVVRSGLSEAEHADARPPRQFAAPASLAGTTAAARGRRAARRPVPIGSPNRRRARRRPQNRRGCARSIGRNWGNSPVGENDRDGRQKRGRCGVTFRFAVSLSQHVSRPVLRTSWYKNVGRYQSYLAADDQFFAPPILRKQGN